MSARKTGAYPQSVSDGEKQGKVDARFIIQ